MNLDQSEVRPTDPVWRNIVIEAGVKELAATDRLALGEKVVKFLARCLLFFEPANCSTFASGAVGNPDDDFSALVKGRR
jgi:hypothetical protein